MDHLSSTVTNRVNQLMAIGTIILTLICLLLMILFKENEEYFDSHGRLGNLAEQEQLALEQEHNRLQSVKRNVKVSFEDKKESKMIIPLAQTITLEQVEVREEFIQNKFIITIKNGQDELIAKQSLQIDSSVMEAFGVYRQKDDLVVEIFCKDVFACDVILSEKQLVMELTPAKEKYSNMILCYIPYEQKNRLFSEEWNKNVQKIEEDRQCKLFLCSELKEPYTEQEVVDFANKLRVDAILAYEIDFSGEKVEAGVICNPTYFIPEFGNMEFATILVEQLQKEFGLERIALEEAGKDEVLIQGARMPAIKAQFLLPPQNMSIEEEYAFNHHLMQLTLKTVNDLP